MKKKIIIITIIVVLILGGLIGYIVYRDKKIQESANKLYSELTSQKTKLENLYTGKYFDFSKDEIKYNGIKPSEGIILIDADEKLKVVSNVKIGNKYCIYDDNKFICDRKYDSKSNVNDITYSEYKVGDAITLNDGTKWHVIHDSNKYSKYVTLISDSRVDINNDGCVMTTGDKDEPDRIPYDKNGSKKYDITVEGNIGYYIENTYKPSLTKLKDILEIRLITNKELEKVETRIKFDSLTDDEIYTMYDVEEAALDSIGWMEEHPRPYHKLAQIKLTEEQYNKLMPHWLYNSLSGNYWVYFSDNKIRTAVWNGNGYASAKPTTGYSLKPVMTLSKDNIKG